MAMSNNTATVLAIGTATPPNFISQKDYPDFFFRSTKSLHLNNLKHKFAFMCEKTRIKKRHMYVTEELLKKYPEIGTYDEPSLDIRQKLLMEEVPKLGMEAAEKAIDEWGKPKSTLTHLIFCTSSGTSIPSADFALTNLLGLSPSINRFMIYQQGCHAGASALRLAKDVVENNPTARVLIVCSENTLIFFRAPRQDRLAALVGSAVFADGAAAVVVGVGPSVSERPLFEVLSAKPCIILGSKDGFVGHVSETGLNYTMSKNLPRYVEENVMGCLRESVEGLGVKDNYNSMFYVVHPGGPRILDVVKERLGLEKGKLEASRHVLREYGNMWSASLLFVLDETRKRSMEQQNGGELGVLLGIGPGTTVETIMLRRVGN